MAGHSKWANIKHRKAATDAKRGKIFSRLIREITVAAKLGGSDAASNPRLRLAIDKAMDNNMPKDTIERAAKRGAGAQEGVSYEEMRYEGYGVHGAAVIVDCLSDNRTRTVADVLTEKGLDARAALHRPHEAVAALQQTIPQLDRRPVDA